MIAIPSGAYVALVGIGLAVIGGILFVIKPLSKPVGLSIAGWVIVVIGIALIIVGGVTAVLDIIHQLFSAAT